MSRSGSTSSASPADTTKPPMPSEWTRTYKAANGKTARVFTTTGATIFYTIDGTNPSTSSLVFASPINVTTTEQIRAYYRARGWADDGVPLPETIARLGLQEYAGA